MSAKHYAALLAVPCVLFVSACGEDTVGKDALEKQIRTQLGPIVPTKIKSVSCPKDIEAKVGKSENCVITYVTGQTVQVKADVTKVTDSKASMHFLITKQLS